MACWYCDRDLTAEDAPGVLVAQAGEAVTACSNCAEDPR
jgi:hypothetical protein